ncbi:MAG: fibronectin type III domain-containing protein, partial [Nanoarchaeota archaeon]
NALNQNSLMRFIAIDQYPPTVAIQSNNVTVNQDLPLTYNADDNSFSFDPQLNASMQCEFYVDGISNNITTITSSGNQTVNINVSGLIDGPHSWYVTCADKAGYSATSGIGTFTLDTTGPNIALVSPLNGSVISNITTIDFEIADLYSNVSSAWYYNGTDNIFLNSSYDAISNWSEGLNTITVYANDTLNNTASSTYGFVIDSSAPLIDLTSSLSDGAYSGNPITIPFDVSDTYSQNLTCTLNIDSTTQTITTGSSGTYAFSNINLQNGAYEWNITCIDQGDNSATTPNRVLNIDAVAPSVTLTWPLDGTVLTNGSVDFNYTVYDTAAISNCTLYLNDIANNTVTAGIINDGITNNIISTILAEGSYAWFISCYDIYNNQGNSSQFSSPWSITFDITPPVISNVTVSSITESSAIISWNINEAANETIDYWIINSTVLSYSAAFSGASFKSVTLNSLTSGTTYYFNITATDQYNNTANLTNFNFTTTIPSSPPGGGGGGGGGGGSEAPCIPNWTVGEWSKCSINGMQTRSVTDKNGCQTDLDKPASTQFCIYVECTADSDCVSGYMCKDNKCEKIVEEPKEEISTTPTGLAILDFIKGKVKYAGIIVLAGLLIYGLVYYIRKRNNVDVNKVREVVKQGRVRKD